jgi:hypothetical protein
LAQCQWGKDKRIAERKTIKEKKEGKERKERKKEKEGRIRNIISIGNQNYR